MKEQAYLEALATAAARVPALADLLPADSAFRAPDGRIGDSLASTEHTMLHYALARRLAGMAEEDMSAALLDLSHETTKVAREQE
jgi:hypothetical protein